MTINSFLDLVIQWHGGKSYVILLTLFPWFIITPSDSDGVWCVVQISFYVQSYIAGESGLLLWECPGIGQV